MSTTGPGLGSNPASFIEYMENATIQVPNGTVAPQIQGPSRYVLYARKSSEADEKQALSIDSQVKEMLAIAEREKLDIVDIRREAHSAKDSGQRPVFQEILKDLRTGC